MPNSEAVLEVENLTISIVLANGLRVPVVRDVTFAIGAGLGLGLVGESGSGKTMVSLAIMGLLPATARVESGRILVEGEDLLKKSSHELRGYRGRRMAMVMQDPQTTLDPSFTIRSQLAEAIRQHRGLRGDELDAAIVEALERVHLDATKDRLNQFPHQLSGGMRQRVVSAIALSGSPSLLIADEPTTALDVTTQARYLALLAELQESTRFALVLVAHDLFIVHSVCSEVAVMYSGQIVERGPVESVFEAPSHPYTRGLLGSVPKIGQTGLLASIEGSAPDLDESIVGCRFASRCSEVRDVCRSKPPHLSSRGDARLARCWGTETDGWIE